MPFTEAWLIRCDPFPVFENYKAVGLARNAGKGGGIAICLRQCYEFSITEPLSRVDPNVECLVLMLKSLSSLLSIGCLQAAKLYFWNF